MLDTALAAPTTTSPSPFLVSFDDVEHSFGYQLASVREPRATQAVLAECINVLAAREEKALQYQFEDTKEQLKLQINTTKAAIADEATVTEVTSRLVRDWELGEKLPNAIQFRRIKEALNTIQKLSASEEATLDAAYQSAVPHAQQGHKTEDFGRKLGTLLFDRMDAQRLNYTDIAA